MNQTTTKELAARKCQPCEGGVPAVAEDEAKRLLESLPGWELTEDGQRIRRPALDGRGGAQQVECRRCFAQVRANPA